MLPLHNRTIKTAENLLNASGLVNIGRHSSSNSQFDLPEHSEIENCSQTVIYGNIFEAIRLNFLRIAENDVILSAICFTLRIAVTRPGIL